MTSSPRSAWILASIVASASPGDALDRPVGAAKLVAARREAAGKLVFVSTDPAVLFPAIGSADDPGTGTPGGASIELLAPGDPTVTLVAPPGTGNPGWKSRGGTVAVHAFKNGAAPGGPSPLRRVVLREGGILRVVGKVAALALDAPAERIAVRVTTGSLRNCAVFEGATATRNEANRFEATSAAAPPLADCSDASLLGLPVPCGESGPTCNGTCPAGDECASFGLEPPDGTCACLPAGSTPCGTPGSPTCGGVCPTAQTCSSVFAPPAVGGIYCDCADAGTTCGNGFAWGGFPEEGFPFACYPILCGGVYPTCGGPCGDGGTCSPFIVDDVSFSACICAVPAPCDDGGFVCPPGEVCHGGPGDGFPACGPP
jgi:hypothetical protein